MIGSGIQAASSTWKKTPMSLSNWKEAILKRGIIEWQK